MNLVGILRKTFKILRKKEKKKVTIFNTIGRALGYFK